MQHFQPPPANTSRYVYSELSCLSSRGKPSLPVEARARYELYKHRLEGTVSKYSHVLNGQPAKLGGRGGRKDLLSKPQVSRQKRISKCRSGIRADAIFGKTKHQLIWKTHMSQLAPRVLLFSPGDPRSDTRTDMYFGLHVILPTSFPRVAFLIASFFFSST